LRKTSLVNGIGFGPTPARSGQWYKMGKVGELGVWLKSIYLALSSNPSTTKNKKEEEEEEEVKGDGHIER
jgi:hypothetical protein